MNHNLVGKVYPTFRYEVGREKIFEYARATLSTNPYCTDPEFAAKSHYGAVVAPPTFAAVYCHQALRNVFDDKELAMNIPRIVHGEQNFEFGEVVKSGDTILTTVTISDIFEKENRKGLNNQFLIMTTESVNQDGELVCKGRWTLVERGSE
ncbi:MAG: MaoC family dehydratase N-terminal domain-containing protein [Candidatus Marinimicrobia bacterium]|nr:MaoC family dehydratase N-terminal domain-containing protein [Candidatus Neomarinimicrobiota bacterium]